MVSIEDVRQMIKNLGSEVDTFGTRKEINYLPKILFQDEKILYLTSGFLNGNTWLIVCTNKRIIFLDKGMFYGLRQIETPLEKINSIQQKIGLIFGEIAIWDGSSKMEIKMVLAQTVRPFVNIVNEAIQNFKIQTQSNLQISEDPISQIEKYAKLKDKGIITQEEFEAKKKQLLNL